MLDRLVVLDHSSGIAGPYCTKLLADAGADVVEVPPGGGDPLAGQGSGGLHEFLHHAKRLAGGPRSSLEEADVFVTDREVDVADLRRRHRSLVVVTITPFGPDGPLAGTPATEFTLQAWCGSTGQRGLPEEPPLAAGGRLGEWLTGSVAAVGALAALREARRSGEGEHVDVAMLDVMATTMVTYPSVFASFGGWPSSPGTGRVVEVPSIEPSSDGFVVFTTNSAQQFEDFLVMIERPDLLEDGGLRRAAGRFERRHEFLAAVRAYTSRHTTEELLARAALFRIPAAPVLHGGNVEDFEQFATRGVFEAMAGGGRAPRVPYRIDRGDRTAPPQAGDGAGGTTRAGDGWRLPLDGLRVLDCTAWWAGPGATNVLAALGADVVKVESTGRPDLMRYSSARPPSDPDWWEWGPLFHAVNVNKRAVTLDLRRPEGVSLFERLAGGADVVVENYTPRVMEQFGLGWERLHELNPSLLMVRMPAFGLDGPWRERTGFAQTMESLSGMAWLTGRPDGPPVLVRGACDPLAGLHAVFATLVALEARDRDGLGRLVEATMVEAALNAAAEQVIEHSRRGSLLSRLENRDPCHAPQNVYRCAGDDAWVALSVASDDQWRALAAVVGEAGWADDPALADAGSRRSRHDELDARIGRWTAALTPEEAAARLAAAGVPAAPVVPPRELARNRQLRHRRLFETEDHPVTGSHEIPVLPIRFGRVDRWLRRPSPTLGQHNAEVLGQVEPDPARLAELEAQGVIGTRPTGS
ncbi:MAG: CaiB/BaiF CoA-transferase family protein [Acidimicrobiales bacterium]